MRKLENECQTQTLKLEGKTNAESAYALLVFLVTYKTEDLSRTGGKEYCTIGGNRTRGLSKSALMEHIELPWSSVPEWLEYLTCSHFPL